MNCPSIIITKRMLKNVNGCGSSFPPAYIFRIPKWVSRAFTKCCNMHDVRYQAQLKKELADDLLYNCMYYSAFQTTGLKRYIKIKIADFVYWCLNTKLSEMCYSAADRRK